MKTQWLTMVLLFSVGAGVGWLVNDRFTEAVPVVTKVPVTSANTEALLPVPTATSAVTSSNNIKPIEASPVATNAIDPFQYFNQLLNAHQYDLAISLYQEQVDEQLAARFKAALLSHLKALLNDKNDKDFSELTSLYLSIYYDDLDVLIFLAEFNTNEGSFIESVNVYQLAKTYIYDNAQERRFASHFQTFVESVDRFYSEREEWLALANFYAHIENSGLLNSRFQFRQAMVKFFSGDKFSAIDQLRVLQSDNIVGEKARNVLKKIAASQQEPDVQRRNPWQGAEKVALQQRGNQYLVDLTLDRDETVTLLIDTGASMTTIARSSFVSLDISRSAREVSQRLFQTANGVTKGTVYLVPQIRIGSYELEDVYIAVLDFTMGSGVDGLLGMNILGQFQFQIDQDNAKLLLDK